MQHERSVIGKRAEAAKESATVRLVLARALLKSRLDSNEMDKL